MFDRQTRRLEEFAKYNKTTHTVKRESLRNIICCIIVEPGDCLHMWMSAGCCTTTHYTSGVGWGKKCYLLFHHHIEHDCLHMWIPACYGTSRNAVLVVRWCCFSLYHRWTTALNMTGRKIWHHKKTKLPRNKVSIRSRSSSTTTMFTQTSAKLSCQDKLKS